jgi:hypothetical protein
MGESMELAYVDRDHAGEVVVMRTRASVGSSMVGLGTLSMRTSRSPCHLNAFIWCFVPDTRSSCIHAVQSRCILWAIFLPTDLQGGTGGLKQGSGTPFYGRGEYLHPRFITRPRRLGE